MEKIDYFYAFINLALGIIFTNLGVKRLRTPVSNASSTSKKFAVFFTLLGIALMVWGVIKLF